VVVCEDSVHCIVACNDGNVYVYNLRSTEVADAFYGHDNSVVSVALTSDEHFVLSASEVKLIEILCIEILHS
jgi:WD40 repeat protein